MDGAKASLRKDRWLAHAEAAYERMFGDAHQSGMVTLAEREAVAVLIGKELKAFLLQEHVAGDPFAHPSHNTQPESAALAPCCPKCHGPGKFAPKKNAEGNKNKNENENRPSSRGSSSTLPSRSIRTEAGDIEVTRERWRCSRCRVVFFSARRSSESGDGRLQRAGASQGDSAGEQAPFS